MYYAILFKHPFVRENEYGIRALFRETNTILISATLSFNFFFLSPIGLLEALSKYISYDF